jgi:hypothetical protein
VKRSLCSSSCSISYFVSLVRNEIRTLSAGYDRPSDQFWFCKTEGGSVCAVHKHEWNSENSLPSRVRLCSLQPLGGVALCVQVRPDSGECASAGVPEILGRQEGIS